MILILGAVLQNCVPEAPHSNPLDPYRAGNGTGNSLTISGVVLQKQAPFFPVAGCKVILSPESIVDTTRVDGSFLFRTAIGGQHHLYLEHPDFQKDSLVFNADSLSTAALQIHLNGLPTIKNPKLTSYFVDQWWPAPVTLLEVEGELSDPDGTNDIVKWTLEIPDFGFQKEFPLTNPNAGIQFTIPTDSIQPFPQQIIGHPLFLQVADKENATTRSDPLFVSRIIEASPDSLAPTGLELAENPPVFRWGAYRAEYPFHYNLAIYVVTAGISSLVHEKNEIAADSARYQLSNNLPAGQYYWTLTVEDEFGNRARSKEAAFIVQN
ncbi:MAG: hypothetical protein Kow0037_01910 [Calditrichia bacterium]